MKKIGIATVTYIDNFGSHLQSYALQEVVKRLGYVPEVINIAGVKREIEKNRRRYILCTFFDIKEIRSYMYRLRSIIARKVNVKYKRNNLIRKRKYIQFAKNYNYSDTSYSWEEMSDMCRKQYESVIVGSDQNWRPANIAGGFYTLEFVPDDVNKIAYATSFGIANIKKNQQKKTKFFLNRINYISVRENTGAAIVKGSIGRDINVVCDPTLLLSAEDWGAYCGDAPLIQGEYILCYFLGENVKHREFVLKLKEETGYSVVAILHGAGYIKEKIKYYDEEVNDIGPFEFLNLIKYSSYVCTDSFHGCAFSMNFHKQFFAFEKFSSRDIMSTNDRLYTMFEWAKIQDRIKRGDEEISEEISSLIDYSEVSKYIEEKRKESYDFLRCALQNGKC